MPSTASECTMEDKIDIDRKKKKKKVQTDGSHEDEEIKLDTGITDKTDTKKTKKERLKSKGKRSSSVSLADDQTEPTSENQNFHSDEANQQSPLLVDEQPVVPVKNKKKKKKRILEGSESLSICHDVVDCENALESPVVLESDEKKRKKKCKEEDINEERNNNEEDESQDNETRTRTTKKSKKKKKTSKNEEEQSESVKSSSHNLNPLDEKVDGEGDSLSPFMTAIVPDDKEKLEKKKKKKHKLKHKEQRELSSSDHIACDEHGNTVAEEEVECDAIGYKMKKKKKRKREEQESDNVCNVEQEQEDTVKSKSKSSKKKKKRENDHGNSMDNDDSQLPQSHTTPTSKLFKDAVFDSAERENRFSRITGKSAKVEDANKIDSSSHANNNIEEKSGSSFVRGQWQGALFETKERQSKFLRLLGGMKSTKGDNKNLFSPQNSSLKKGLYGSLSASVPNLNSSSDNTANTRGGKALSISDAAEINKRLEEDYNKAMNFKLSGTRGAGLGFAPDPAEGKKFHIDANSTKSLKFDNDDD